MYIYINTLLNNNKNRSYIFFNLLSHVISSLELWKRVTFWPFFFLIITSRRNRNAIARAKLPQMLCITSKLTPREQIQNQLLSQSFFLLIIYIYIYIKEWIKDQQQSTTLLKLYSRYRQPQTLLEPPLRGQILFLFPYSPTKTVQQISRTSYFPHRKKKKKNQPNNEIICFGMYHEPMNSKKKLW